MSTATNPVNWFEIPTTDLNRAKRFYEIVFEIELSLHDMGPLKMAWFPMQPDAPGATGTLVQSDHYTPSHEGTLVYFSVPDIEAALERVTANSGKIINAKTSIGEYGFVGHFEDCEGNRVALHSET
jgi:predicted enzyme related to lactoylglutathione lyase